MGQLTNLADLVRNCAASAPERTALVCGDRRISWGELDRSVDTAAAALSGAGLVAGFRVGLALGNSIEFVTAYFGALRAGLVAVPIDPASSPEEVARLVSFVRARVVLAEPSSIRAVRTAIRTRDAQTEAEPTLVVPVGVDAEPGERAYDDLLATAPRAPVVSPADPEMLAVLLFTSGTTGAPRAVMLSHRALLANVEQVSRIEPTPVQPDDVVLGLMPFSHVYGLNGVLGLVARQGATLVLVDRFDPSGTLDLIAAEKVTHVPVVPQVLASWTRQPKLAERLASVRVLVSGAAPLPQAVRDAIEQATRLTVHEGYGLTEAAPTVTSTLCSPRWSASAEVTGRATAAVGAAEQRPASDSGEATTHAGARRPGHGSPPGRTIKAGSVGAPVPGVELRIVDDTGADVEPGDPGEILVRGDNLFSGYWPDGHGAPAEKGWFATGDVGYLDPDGDLVLVDRVQELISVAGFSVFPREVEDVIVELDAVAEAAVVGVPDPRGGRTIKAYVVPRLGHTLTTEMVVEYCGKRLARFKRPAEVEIVSELPRSVTGTVAKAKLRQGPSEPSSADRESGGSSQA
ncbi:MAG TPA: AMP-binding protein [Actinopolymorphaceae bacterium]